MMLPIRSQGQETPSEPKHMMNRMGFVGTWEGDYGHFRKDNPFRKEVFVHDVLEIIVFEDPKGRGLVMDYTYGVKGKKGYGRRRRHFVIDPVNEKIFMHWSNDPDDVYNATGLDVFAQKGMGVFQVEGPIQFQNFPQKYVYKGLFELTGDTWNYRWDSSSDGISYKVFGSFQLHRVVP